MKEMNSFVALALFLGQAQTSKISDISNYPTWNNKYTDYTVTTNTCVGCIRSGFNWIFENTKYWKTAESNVQ